MSNLKLFFASLMNEQSALNKNENQIQQIEGFLCDAKTMLQRLVITWSTYHKIKHQCRNELRNLYYERDRLKAAYSKKYAELWEARNSELALKRESERVDTLNRIEDIRREIGPDAYQFLVNNKHLLD